MVEMDSRLKKKQYRFELKKKYQYTGHFKLKERPPIEAIKDSVKALLKPRKAERAPAPAAFQQPQTGFNFLVFGGFLLIAFILFIFAWLYLTLVVLQPGPALFQPQVEKSSIDNTLESGSIITTGARGAPMYLAAVLVDHQATNLDNLTITLTPYKQRLPSEVFILESERFDASTYPDFVRVLRSDLARRKIILNEMTLKDLETMPQGAIVIVPSGAIPKELLGFDSRISLNKLADRGIILIYIGQPFNKMLNGTLVSFTPKETLKGVPASFDENAGLESEDGFSLYDPLYRASPTMGWTGDIAYGSVSYIFKGDGGIIFVPQTLDGGWRGDYDAAANDVSRIIFENAWAEPVGEPRVYTFTNDTGLSGTEYLFTSAFKDPRASVKVDFVGYPPSSNFTVDQTLSTYLQKEGESSMFVEEGGTVVSSNITDQLVRISALLREPVAAQPMMYILMLDSLGNEAARIPKDNVNVQADHSFDVPIYLERGEYIVQLVDDAGKAYSSAYMKVVSIDITPKGIDDKKQSVYLFDVTMDGQPRTLGDVTVVVDNGTMGTYQFQDVDKIRVDVGQYTGGEQLSFGKHDFHFKAGALTVDVAVPRNRARTIFDEPMFWIALVLSGALAVVGAVFARPEHMLFALDVPDFPPVARTKIPLPPDTILSIFEKVNDTYRWQNTPLTPAEVKNGFKDVFVQGKPIYITDFNVDFLLEELEKRGLVKESLGYYGLASWEAKRGRSIEYLSMMRKLRDICVNNAIPFTGIGESEQADSVITVVGQQMTVHFFEKKKEMKGLLGRVLPTIGKGIAIVLFRSQNDKEQFQIAINSSPSAAPLIVKMETDSSSLLLLTDDELEKMLIEFKSM
ncbi:MAG: hypothetical protein V1827_00660 [Candidatus Micrarchaeota archaeon]